MQVNKEAIKQFILSLDPALNPSATPRYEAHLMGHLRMSAIYWALGSLCILGEPIDGYGDAIVGFVDRCKRGDGGYGGDEGQDSHLLHTLSAVQVLCLLNRTDLLDKQKTAAYTISLQRPDGSFTGDLWGEVDTRFSYCAIAILYLLGMQESHLGQIDAAVRYIEACRDVGDGSFAAKPGAESHGGQVFCCVAALSIVEKVDLIDTSRLLQWLAFRQTSTGGLNGRPQKSEDVCYSWWILASLAILEAVDCIDAKALHEFILKCQDDVEGGIADRPGDVGDLFHTFFGLAGTAIV